MKKVKSTPENTQFFESVKRAMPAAARRARKMAKMYGYHSIPKNRRIVVTSILAGWHHEYRLDEITA